MLACLTYFNVTMSSNSRRMNINGKDKENKVWKRKLFYQQNIPF